MEKAGYKQRLSLPQLLCFLPALSGSVNPARTLLVRLDFLLIGQLSFWSRLKFPLGFRIATFCRFLKWSPLRFQDLSVSYAGPWALIRD